MKIGIFFCNLLVACALAPGLAHAADAPKELRVVRITPEGEDVKSERQIVFEFNRAVVPIGRMERTAEEIPVTITPKVECQWRWLNTTTLSCNIDDAHSLAEATHYKVDMRPGIRAEDGAAIAENATAEFTTQRPDIRYTGFDTWLSPSTPVVALYFNQPVTKRSVRDHVRFGSSAGDVAALVYPRPDDTEVKAGREEARQTWLARPKEELPLDSDAFVALTPGLVSANGPELSTAERQVVTFHTYPAFRFVGLACVPLYGEGEIHITANDADNASKCDPMSSISLEFSTPVDRASVKQNVSVALAKDGKSVPVNIWSALKNDEDEDSDEDDSVVDLSRSHEQGTTYRVYLPWGLKAASEYTISSEPPAHSWWARTWHRILAFFHLKPHAQIQDGFSRTISEPFTLRFATDHRKPNFEMPNQQAILEKGVDSELPLYVTNIGKAAFDFGRLNSDGVQKNQHHALTPPGDVTDIQFAIPAGLRAMLGGKSGALFGTINTEPNVDKDERERQLFGEVTPYSVHAKIGHFASLVWVTDFATGKPVEGARVTLYQGKFTDLAEKKDVAGALTDASGIAQLPGTQAFDPKQSLRYVWQAEDTRLMLRVDKGEDMALLPLSEDFSVDIWRASNETIYPSTEDRYGHLRSWGTTAQGVYRVGQTIQYKLYVRNESNRSLVAAPKGHYTLEIIDPTGKTVDTQKDVALSAFGSYSGEYTVPESAIMGWYQFRLTVHFDDMDGKGENAEKKYTRDPMRVLVSDFTPASFSVKNELNGEQFGPKDDVNVTTDAVLYSGGAYTDAAMRLTAEINPAPFSSKDPALVNFRFDSGEDESSSAFLDTQGQIGDKGSHEYHFTLPDAPIVYGTLTVESAVADDRGKYIAAVAHANYIGRDRYVGLYSPKFVYEANKEAPLQYIVTDAKGKPAAGTKVEMMLEREFTTMARVKGAGNAYLPQFTSEWKKIDSCSGTSGNEPGSCKLTTQVAGSYRVTASIKDSRGREHHTTYPIWVTGSDYVLWDDGDSNALALVPEKTDYKVGDTARYLVRNPYPGASALVTIERYGVLDSFVTTLEGSTPTISFPVKADYLPGFYLSVIAVSPRVDKPYGGVGEVDLGKPAYRIGYAQMMVKDPYKEITVTPKIAREEYRPRDDVEVSVHAEPKKPGAKPEPIEIAAIALDQSVFDLIAGGRSYFDPYAGLYTLDGLDLRNYSLLTRLIGRQKFEKKGANPGGDGGADMSLRNIFKFVAYWNPELKTDAQGNASFHFEAPDNLTGWRVLAIAATPSDRFGLGSADFKVNRPTEVRPVMPNQVMEGDQFTAQFSVMNRTDKPRTIKVEITAQGTVKADKKTAHAEHSVTLEPYKRTVVSLPLSAAHAEENRDAPPAFIYFTAKAGDAIDSDGMEYSLPVLKARNLITAATYGTTMEDATTTSIAFPKDIKTDVGSVSVVASPSVIANVEGAFRYMRDYPYICWEQKLTKAAMAAHYLKLSAYMPKSFAWKNSDAIPQKTLDEAASFQSPGGGMAYFKPLDDYSDPYLSAYTALAFNWLEDAGYKVPEDVEAKLHGYLLDLLRHDAVPTFYNEGMTSDVRAMALAALAPHGKVTREDIARYAPHMKRMSLMGKAQFLAAASALGDAPDAKDTFDAIMSTGVESGGKFTFNETIDDSFQRILASAGRENCAILSSLLAYGKTPEGAELVGDKPFKLVRSITQTRGARDHWENTQENMFCMASLVDYARNYETVTPNMNVAASLDNKPFGQGHFAAFSDAAQTYSRPIEPQDAGRSATVNITRSGAGRLYYSTRLSYAPSDGSDASQNAGIDLHREYSVQRNGKWELLKTPAAIKRGELVRVDLYASLPTARNFVVIDDPVPGGLEPVNRDLATSSQHDADAGEFQGAEDAFWFKFSDWSSYGVSRWSFYHEEIRHDSVRYYSDYLPAGHYHLAYTAQAVAAGTFSALPAKAEEMYDPDVFGTSASLSLVVSEKQ